MSELVGVALLFAGLAILLCGLGWLIAIAFRKSGWIWGTLVLCTSPVGPLTYGLSHFRNARTPLVLVLLGLIVGAVPFAYSHGFELIFGLGERERLIDGERHLVLTGWDRPDYNILNSRSDTVVLELANPNVDDTTLELLMPFQKLRELTLNDSSVSDAGLKTLKKLTSLQSLRLARTKVTKDGIAEFLLETDSDGARSEYERSRTTRTKTTESPLG